MIESKVCKNCLIKFQIRPEDKAFYERIQVPEPSHCPACRQQRRLAVRNEMNLYKRKCDLCSDPTISTFFQESKYKVFCNKCWWSDSWDATDYGQAFDFKRPFFEQLAELERKTPHFATFNDSASEDCEFTNYGMQNKSCYLSLCGFSENIYFSNVALFSKSCIDCSHINRCELCCDCIDCHACYSLAYSKDCKNCSNSMFLNDCKNCKNCFLCTGQNNKEYMVMNQQLTQEQYQEYLTNIKLDYQMVTACQESLQKLNQETPKKCNHNQSSENVSGDYINSCKNCYQCFDTFNNLLDSAYCDTSGVESNLLYDCSNSGAGSTQCYESIGSSRCNNVKFSNYCKPCFDSDYIQYCSGSHLFGCIGIQNKEYCILNKQYSPEEYFYLKSQIIEHMKQTGEWGEFFPINNSSFAYNKTLANEFFPMTKEQVLEKGWKWQDEKIEELKPATTTPPPLIEDAPREITKEILACQNCHKNYKIISRELGLRQQIKVPLNPFCPACRHTQRFQKRNPRTLFDRSCAKCQSPIQTTYSPDRPEIVYCEQCYLDSLN